MTVIHRYISQLFFKYFGIVLGVVIVIYLSIDFFGRIDKFIEAEISPSLIAAFFLYKIPLIVSQITPIAVLLGVLAIFGLMAKNNEILALKSGGISLNYLLLPIVVIGTSLSILLFLFSEVVVPISVVKANRIEELRSGAKMMTSREKNIWIRGNQSITHIEYYNPADQMISGISIAYFNKDFSLTSRINARTGKYIDGNWTFFDCLIQQHLDSPDKDNQVIFHDEKICQIDLVPADLLRVAKESEEMPFTDLYQYILKVESEGYDATKYRVDFYAKTAFPFICFIISMFGAGLALRGSTKEGMVISFAYGILTVFIYWSFYSFCLSLGYGNVLPPMFAAWIANLIFFCAAGLVVYNME
ncbi:MAG: LPS export ABC transporter permease LptG [Desulfobacteraceae bacterium]|nr:LPS export ABC transporter permease LptG [Desulfobacteraceae bacterium]MBC2755304.1 LPS export ABC transporter permease LptG [Desulfobacteraceae bacterium]